MRAGQRRQEGHEGDQDPDGHRGTAGHFARKVCFFGISALCLVTAPVAGLAAPPTGPAAASRSTRAGSVTGTVTVVRGGKIKRDASQVVVYLVGFTQPPPPVTTAATRPRLGQRNKQFEQRLLAITAGQRVDFPNADGFFHNVFSLSKTRRFDLGQFKKGHTKTKTFPRKGIVEVYCNIHPSMSATILVLPNRAHAMANKAGVFRIADVPPGTWTAYAYSHLAAKPTRVKGVVVTAGQVTTVTGLKLNEDRLSLKHKNKYGQAYKDAKGRY